MSNFYQQLRALLLRGWRTSRRFVASGRLRRVRALAFQAYVLLALLGFAGLALLAVTTPVFQPDVEATREVQAELPAWAGEVLWVVSWFGYGVPAITLTALIIAYLAFSGMRWEAAAAAVTAAGTALLNLLVKVAIRRPRPGSDLVEVVQQLDSFSFPSGHVMFYTGFYGFLLFLTFTLLHRGPVRFALMLFLALLVGLVGLSRVYLGEHWTSDVIGGYLLGSLALFLSIAFYRWGKKRYFATQPVAADENGEGDKAAEEKEIRDTVRSPLIPKTAAQKELNDEHPDHPET